MQLTIKANTPDATCVAAAGRITQENIDRTRDLFRELLGPDVYCRNVLMSLRDAEFMDSSGVSWLLRCHKRFAEQGGRLVLCTVPQILLNTIKVLRMHLVLDIVGTEEEGLQRIRDSTPNAG